MKQVASMMSRGPGDKQTIVGGWLGMAEKPRQNWTPAWSRILLIVRCLTLYASIPSVALAVDIEETIWGFDGRVVPYRFNPVSLLVSNTTEDPVNVRLQLKRSQRPGGDRIGARVEEDVFLSPFSSRWVQFYPYIASENDAWAATWGFLPSQRKELQSPKIGGPARVALVNSDQLTRRQEKAKSFPEELFPPFVSATDTLQAVILDHVPRWQEPRRETLLAWVQRGGTLVVTPSASGEYPVFTAELAIFNSPLPEFAVGQGQVIRVESHEAAASMLDQRLGKPVAANLSSRAWEWPTNIFQTLKSISTPQHNWWMINFMSLVYVGLVFPGWYLLSRASRNYRTTILAFVGVAILFTVAFNIVGRRGYGESTTVNTLAIARKIEGDTYDVQSWTNVFVTGGAQYELKFDGVGHLYSTASLGEKIAATIDNGLDGTFVADIPLFSSRSFIHQGQAVGPQWEVKVRDYATDGRPNLEDIEVEISPQPDAELLGIYAIYLDRLHHLNQDDECYRLHSRSQLVAESLVPEDFGRQNDYRYRYGYQRPQADPEIVFNRLIGSAIWRSSEQGGPLPPDRLRVFIFADLPASFSVKNPQLEASQGKALYSMDVLLPGPLATQEKGGDASPKDDLDDSVARDDEIKTEPTSQEPSDDEPSRDE